ncbi:EF-hand domain-containing protein [Allokutzneria oryzae]|uniref:EF-hand domain-containing protein n=1 Tax=Allokutzneria oryzae TaxID=1378989 RepID=A0ABV5ZN78_9PSEU
MGTTLYQQRLEKDFERYDADHDGVIDQTDIHGVVQALCQAHNVPPGSPTWREVTTRANRLWQHLEGHLDDNGDKVISLEEWTAGYNHPGFVDEVALPLAEFAFRLGDRDGDGKLSLDEWMTSQTAFGVGQVEAIQNFHRLDENGDGYVTTDEHARAVRSFYSE